ncbi:MAG TPA: hypothetical protein VIY54_02455 [Steroidobacteraceae bacterium]
MHELVIVLSDLYLPPAGEAGEARHPLPPGLEHVARFASRVRLDAGWRNWVAGWLGAQSAGNVGRFAAATVAARPVLPIAAQSAADRAVNASVWLAEPVHLLTGLTSLHLERRALLRLAPDELAALASDFRTVFEGGAYELLPLATGNFLLLGPQVTQMTTAEPARCFGADISAGMPHGPEAGPLRRLSTEVQMWLHDHAINRARSACGEPPVNALWFWGEGAVSAVPAAQAAFVLAAGTLAFGCDAFLAGLYARTGAEVLTLPAQLDGVFSYPRAQRAVLVLDVGQVLRSNSQWTLGDALAQIDLRFIAPAVQSLRAGRLRTLIVIANDWQLSLTARDRLKRWRRRLPGLGGLQ